MVRRRSLRVRAAIVLATGMTLVPAGAASASTAPQPAIAVAGVTAVGLSVVVAPASRYAVTVTNVGDAAATASGDDPSSIAIEGASAGAIVSGAGLECTPGDGEIDCAFAPALAVAPGEAVIVNVDGATADDAGAVFSVAADFNGAETSVDVSTTAETYDTATTADSGSAPAQPGARKKTAVVAQLSPALRIQRRVRARTVTITVAHAKGAAGRLTVTAEQDHVRGRHGTGAPRRSLKVTRARIAGRYRYRFKVRKGAYTVSATWAGTGRWADQTRTRAYRAR